VRAVCGIVGLFTKNPALEPRLGEHVAAMLVEMSGRGPDSAGVAVYRNPAPGDRMKLVLFHPDPGFAWGALAEALGRGLGAPVEVAEVRASHAILLAPAGPERVRPWLAANHPSVRLTSAGRAIEIFKEKGAPRDVAERFSLRGIAGSHAVGHTRMATESAVTTEHSHPFSTGMDLCLVHNGSLSNHNRLRERLRREGGVEFQTDNDSEVAAGYLAWRMGQGASLREALEAGLRDLDGFYTFCVGTEDGFAVLRDPIACKHAVLAETDDWVAMSTEYRAIARLPGAEKARIWEPAPGQVYSWGRH
jgi:methylamine---glutamate N-methyltransferase subunit A